MKKLSLYLLMMAIGLITYSQKIDKSQVPESVKKMYEIKMNDTLSPAWEKVGTNFQASLSKGELKATVLINDRAEWQKTVWEMPYQYVPQKIKDNIAKSYEGFKVIKSSIQYRTDGDYYVFETKKKKLTQILDYDLKGDFIKIETPAEIKKEKK